MNLSINGLNGFSIFSQKFGTAGMLKSTQDKLERQQKAQSQIEFFENQKENLKNMQCDSIEDIARKLEMFHSYEDQIAAVKKQYNNEQMFHTMDEARERGEQIAELAEDYAPKTEEVIMVFLLINFFYSQYNIALFHSRKLQLGKSILQSHQKLFRLFVVHLFVLCNKIALRLYGINKSVVFKLLIRLLHRVGVNCQRNRHFSHRGKLVVFL